MKIAIVGAGLTGLASAYFLAYKNHQITIFEKEKEAGGLSASFSLPGWSFPIERHYHHWFTNDSYILDLIEKLGLSNKLIFPPSLTSVYFQGKIYPLNSPFHVLTFSPVSIVDRLRLGLVLLYLKLLPAKAALKLEKYTAENWLLRYFGKNVYATLWQPLLLGKFGSFASKVNMAWFWTRIKKRTSRLGYLIGGHQRLTERLVEEIRQHQGKVLVGNSWKAHFLKAYDKVIFTAPTAEFISAFPQLPKEYKKRLSSIPHLHALTLVILGKEKLLKDTYWLNINERDFPFVGVVQHTNMIDSKYYGGSEAAYIANYLPDNHPYLKMTKEELLKIYLPYLAKINPQATSKSFVQSSKLFLGPFAQPVFPLNYSKIKPDFATPIPNVYLANMDMVYPWDRGTNYAVELGYKVAQMVC